MITLNRTVSAKLHERAQRSSIFADHGPLVRSSLNSVHNRSPEDEKEHTNIAKRSNGNANVLPEEAGKQKEFEEYKATKRQLKLMQSNNGHSSIARSMTEIAEEILHNHDAAAELLEQENALYITPRSTFMKGWDSLIALLLVYTAIMTPFEISFLGDSNEEHNYFTAAKDGVPFIDHT